MINILKYNFNYPYKHSFIIKLLELLSSSQQYNAILKLAIFGFCLM